MKNIIVAITGASGAIYARQLLDALGSHPGVGRIALVVSPAGIETGKWEKVGTDLPAKAVCYAHDDLMAPIASGSSDFDAMVVVPCTMGTLGRIAAGVSTGLISRAADVMLKERRKLILVARETPLSAIHLRNMLTLTECGAVILPACPSFYSHPADIHQLAHTVTDRVLDQLGLETGHYRWGQ